MLLIKSRERRRICIAKRTQNLGGQVTYIEIQNQLTNVLFLFRGNTRQN